MVHSNSKFLNTNTSSLQQLQLHKSAIIDIRENYNFGILNLLMVSNLDGSANLGALKIFIKKWLRRQDSLNALRLIAQGEMALFISQHFLLS